MQGENKNTQNKSEYQKRYQDIVTMPLSPDNVDSYADKAMDQLSDLIAEIEEKSKWDDLSLSGKEREDKIFAEALPGTSVEATLDRIDDVAQRLRQFDEMIQEVRNNPDNLVILPPEGMSERIIGNGDDFRENPILPKLKTELFVLEQDFGMDVRDPDQVRLSSGVVSPNMQRQMSYDVIELPELERLILSCDECGNRTYIFDTAKLEEFGITAEMIKNGTKSQLNELLTVSPEAGKSIRYSTNYVERIRGAIENPASELIPEKDLAERAEYLKTVERAPEGWMTRRNLADALGVNSATIKKYYDAHIKEIGPTKSMANAQSKQFEFFSPEQVEKITQFFESKKGKAPKGWMTSNGLASELSTSRQLINDYYKAHADELGPLAEYTNDRNVTHEYFSPQQIQKIKQHFEEMGEEAPENWMTMRAMGAKHGFNPKVLRESYKEHADEIGAPKGYLNGQHRKFEYYSPEQIAKILEYAEKDKGQEASR